MCDDGSRRLVWAIGRCLGVWAVVVLLLGGSARSTGAEEEDHEHMLGAVEAMTPHQRESQHMKHMKWTAVRPANARDAERADHIVQVLREAL